MSAVQSATPTLGMDAPVDAASAPVVVDSIGADVQRVTRVVNISFTGSLARFSEDGESALRWSPVENKHATVFAAELGDEASFDPETASKRLANTSVVDGRVLQYHNGLPFSVGLNVSCLPRLEAVDTGARYTFTALPNAQMQTPQTLFQADAATQRGQVWKQKYKGYTAANLEAMGVIEMPSCPYVFMDEAHPVTEVLRANADLLKTDVDTCERFDGKYLKIARPLMKKCCAELRSRVLNNIATHDLNQFHVTMQRTDGNDWMEIGGGGVALADFNPTLFKGDELAAAQEAHINNFLHKEYQFSARIELTYELPR